MLLLRNCLPILLSVLLFFETATVTKADLILQFSPDNSVSSVSVIQGQTFEVDLYIAESGAFTGLSDSGLLGFGFRGWYSGAMIQATGGITEASFNVSGTPNADISTSGQVDMYGGASIPPKAPVIHLGTLNFQALSSGMTTITFGDLDPTWDDFSLNDPTFTSLDSTLFGQGLDQTFGLDVTITAVPEPSSAVFSLSACAMFLISHWLRRRRGVDRG